jgi:hypothetical protein
MELLLIAALVLTLPVAGLVLAMLKVMQRKRRRRVVFLVPSWDPSDSEHRTVRRSTATTQRGPRGAA